MTLSSDEGYRFLEHTSDAFIEAWGPTLEDAFAQAARGFFDTMINLTTVEPSVKNYVEAEGHDSKELLYEWLETLLLKFDRDGMVYSEFDIRRIYEEKESLKLQAHIGGEHYSLHKHGAKVEIKGITYHEMELQKIKDIVTVRFILDL